MHLLLLVSIISLSEFVSVKCANETSQYRFAVVVDCGSSGSRAQVFRWPSNCTQNQLMDQIRPLRDASKGTALKKRISPGLSSLRDNPEWASDYMKPLMDFASFHVPQELQESTPVYFMATAGLRLLTLDEQKRILDDISRDLKLEYRFQDLRTEVISGAQEGIYMWLSANILMHKIPAQANVHQSLFCLSPQLRKVGLVEVGGASMQVTFELQPELDAIIRHWLKADAEALETFAKSRSDLQLGSRGNSSIFSTTFLGFGTNSARSLAADLIFKDALWPQTVGSSSNRFVPSFVLQGTKHKLSDPCLPSGASQTLEKPLRLWQDQSRLIGFSPKSGEATFELKLEGDGDSIRCQKLLRRLVMIAKQQRLNCSPTSCPASLIGKSFVPYAFVPFVGLSELYYSTKLMIDSAGSFNAARIISRTASICSTPFAVLEALYGDANQSDPTRVLLECFKSNWILVLLQSVTKMPLKSKFPLTTVNTVDGFELDWTFGALIAKLTSNGSF